MLSFPFLPFPPPPFFLPFQGKKDHDFAKGGSRQLHHDRSFFHSSPSDLPSFLPSFTPSALPPLGRTEASFFPSFLPYKKKSVLGASVLPSFLPSFFLIMTASSLP
jgi:hypothetical protein